MKATALVCDENQDFTLELVRLGGPAPHQVVIRTHYTGVPSEKSKERSWRTHPDAFAGLWDEEIAPLLRGDAKGKLQATAILGWMSERHPGRFSASHLCTLQRVEGLACAARAGP